jgi:uncharacterized protein (DUF58 family)
MIPHPDSAANPVDSETLDAVSSLTVRVRRAVEGLQGGDHASLHIGASVEFAEHKKYSPGDDIRNIDWKALARTDRYFVKTFEREVTLRCLMLVDCSPSMGYRGTRAELDKLGYAVVLLGAMSHVLVRQGDAVGLLPFAESPLDYLPPKRRPEHLPILMSHFSALEPARGTTTGYADAIRVAAERAGRRAMIAVATDLWGAGEETEVALKSLAARGHDIVLFHVLSPDEVDLPFDRVATFAGMEGEGDVDVDPSLIREDYRRTVEELRERWRRSSGEAGIDLVQAITAVPPHVVLADFAARRHRNVSGIRR